MNRILCALALAMLATACVPRDGAGPGTSAEGWRQIAVGAGTVIGRTKADPAVAKASAKLAEYCGALQTVAIGATLFAPENQRRAAAIASAAVTTVCASPPADVASALIVAADTYSAVRAAQGL
jgi:hypothetical protein